MKTSLSMLMATLVLSCVSILSKATPPTVSVDLNKYSGLWFEQGRVPNSFQDKTTKKAGRCFNTTAEYTLRSDGKIDVINTCFRLRKDGGPVQVDRAKALGKVVAGSNNSRLKVNFTGIPLLRWLGIGNGDYWVLALGPINAANQYEWVLVGGPTTKYGWLLTRSPIIDDALWQDLLTEAETWRYDRQQFIRTRQ